MAGADDAPAMIQVIVLQRQSPARLKSGEPAMF
jgi:hypothetical protein